MNFNRNTMALILFVAFVAAFAAAAETSDADGDHDFIEGSFAYDIIEDDYVAVYGDSSVSGELKIESTVTHGGKQYNVVAVGNNAFSDTNDRTYSGVTSIVIGEGVIALGDSSFIGCTGVRSLTMPDSLTTVGEGAFANIPSTESWELNIGVNLINLGNAPFGACNISKFTVDSKNKYLSVGDDGVLYGNGGTDLIQAPSSVEAKNGEFEIPANVEIIRSMAFYYCAINGSLVIGENVTSIDYFAFCHSTIKGEIKFKNPTLSKLKTIEDYGFNNCKFVEEGNAEFVSDLEIPDSVLNIGCKSFTNCNIGDLKIGDGVKWIGDHAFEQSGTSTITSVSLGKSVFFIGVAAFGGCSNFTDDTLVIPSSVECICESAFFGTLSADITVKFEGSSMPVMGQKCFSFGGKKTIDFKASWAKKSDFDYYITSNDINVKVNGTPVEKEEGTDTFDEGDFTYKIINKSDNIRITGYKGSGENLVIPGTVEHNAKKYTVTGIEYCFSGLTGKITFPESLTTIMGNTNDKGAFENCNGLDGTLTIPAGLTRMGINSFCSCTGLEYLEFEKGCQLKYLPGKSFNFCEGLKGTITIPDSMIVIGYVSMRGLTSIEHINLGSGIKMICGESMEMCGNLKNIVFNENVEYIGFYALKDSGLSSNLTIPAKVRYIGTSAFAGGGDMDGKKVTFLGDEPILGASSLFFGYNLKEYKEIEIEIATNGWGDSIGSRVLGTFTEAHVVDNDPGKEVDILPFVFGAVLILLAASAIVAYKFMTKPKQ